MCGGGANIGVGQCRKVVVTNVRVGKCFRGSVVDDVCFCSVILLTEYSER